MENIKLPTQKAQDSGYKQRFVNEYTELKDRHRKLRKMLVKYDAGKLEFTPTCPIDLLRKQKSLMGEYLNVLEIRAVIEDVELPE